MFLDHAHCMTRQQCVESARLSSRWPLRRRRDIANSVICAVARPQTVRNRLNMKSLFMLCAVGSVMLAVLAGCSSDSCENAAPCGGDIVGTWKATSGCGSATRSALNGDCPAATALVGTFLYRSTISYGADMTYSFAGNSGGRHLRQRTGGAPRLRRDLRGRGTAVVDRTGLRLHRLHEPRVGLRLSAASAARRGHGGRDVHRHGRRSAHRSPRGRAAEAHGLLRARQYADAVAPP